MRGLILMTAMPPTKGHRFLIEFARQFMGNGQIDVIVNTRDCEPLCGLGRANAISASVANAGNVTVHHYHGDVPQNPSEHLDFWNIWKNLIRASTGTCKYDYVFASELYGVQLAKTVGAKFIPCDIGRDILGVKATSIREDPIKNFSMILPEYQKCLRKTVTIFGAESCGKTTMARALSSGVGGHFIPEWARGYLELDPVITDDKMLNIVHGQHAIEMSVDALNDKPFIFRDTDLFSTLGYYEIYKGNGNYPNELIENVDTAHLYVIMNDSIPFEPDVLRYGVDKRESNTAFWVEIADRFGLNYHVVQSTDRVDQYGEVTECCRDLFMSGIKGIDTFVRT